MDFWSWFWLFFIYVPLIIIWVTTLVDIFSRSDLSGWVKALWTIALFFLPWLGVFVYLVSRPPTVSGAWGARGRETLPPSVTSFPTTSSTAQELEKLAALRSQGALTEEEYAAAKASIITGGQQGSKAA
jgi:hypothetical protein